MKDLYFAPVQGHTDAAYRHFHSKVYKGDLTYYTPFIRLEKGTLRAKDIKDLNSPLNSDLRLVPQIIFKDAQELKTLIALLKDNGAKEIDLNMGCPFPLQTGHGRGAASIVNQDLAYEIEKAVNENHDIVFSLKMRLGLNDPEEWKFLIPFLNRVHLDHITLHPRIAKQQYSGDLYMDQFEDFLNKSTNPVVFNGDITTPEKFNDLIVKYPGVKGFMAARGILGRPSMFEEYSNGVELPKEERIAKMLDFHRQLFNHYSSILCGDAQIISKIKPFWEYSENEIGRKAWKAIKKATNLSKYQTAVAMI